MPAPRHAVAPVRAGGEPLMQRVLAAVGRFVGRDDCQDLLEYGLLVGLIALILVAAVTSVGNVISSVFWGYIAAAI